MTSNVESKNGDSSASNLATSRSPSFREMTTEDVVKALAVLNAGGVVLESQPPVGTNIVSKTKTIRPRRRSANPKERTSEAAKSPDEAAKLKRRKSKRPMEKETKGGNSEGDEAPKRRIMMKKKKPVDGAERASTNPKQRPRKKKPTDDTTRPSGEEHTGGVEGKRIRRPTNGSNSLSVGSQKSNGARPRRKKPTDDASRPTSEEQENGGEAKRRLSRRPSKKKQPSEDTDIPSGGPQNRNEARPRKQNKTTAVTLEEKTVRENTDTERPKRHKTRDAPKSAGAKNRSSKTKVHNLASVEEELMALVKENQKKKAEALGVGMPLPPIQENSGENMHKDNTAASSAGLTGTIATQPQQQQNPSAVPEATMEDIMEVFGLTCPVTPATAEQTEMDPLLTPESGAKRASLGASASSFHTICLEEKSPPNISAAAAAQSQQEGAALRSKNKRQRKEAKAANETKATRAAPVDLRAEDAPEERPLPKITDALLLVEDPPVRDHLELVERHYAKEKIKQRKARRTRACIVFLGFLLAVGVYMAIHAVVFGWGGDSPADPPTLAPTLGDFLIPAGLSEQTKEAILADPTSPQFRAYSWLARDPQRDEYPEWQLLQRFAVATMVFSLRKPDSAGQMNDPWLVYDQSECDWGGSETNPPRCHDNGRIFNLELSEVSGLEQDVVVAALPAEISMLDQLERLGISKNRAFVPWADLLPPEMKLLAPTFRTLDVSQNELHDPIAASSPLFSLSNLESLNASQNFLIGKVPSEIATLRKLKQLDISQNRFTGSIPSEIASLEKLEILSLNGNELIGRIPRALGSMKSLVKLNLGNSSLTGQIPTLLGLLSNSLESLDLSKTLISGRIPSQVGLLGTLLKHLDLGSNAIGGRIPSEIGSLRALHQLTLSLSTLTGAIPTEIGGLVSAEQVDLSNTLLAGALPSQFGLMTNLKWLDLSQNDHSGKIPAEVGLLGQLNHLDLSKNSLTGQFDLFFMAALDYLDVGSNFLTGRLPFDLTQDMTSLRVLRFNGNYLSGPIATEIGLLTQLVEVDLSTTAVTGTIPSQIGLLTNLEVLKLSTNLLRGDIPTELSGLSSLRHVELQGTEIEGVLPPGFCGPRLTSLAVDCKKIKCGDCDCDCR